ncbi:acyltransferase family protein [Paenibacillus whitsoniae]|uniref:Acyltransferase n=1 Tax=Paenibacillus whitsoniae TaxID=2496558 RepID=A0A3S0A787_9BACL|nr:acyltransferase [Paenibacillus whitsoniae]RTE11235.1 acyltransferase [Paenibacillus whitsoniae]
MKRYEELDSLRGLAALSVVLYHLAAIFPSFDQWDKNPFFHLLFAGHEAVLFFFVLSGFVLSIPFFSETQPPYSIFILKRFFRIYIPYICCIVLAILCCLLFTRGGIPALSDWFNLFWVTPYSNGLLLNHIFLIGNYETDAYNPVIWSLVHEMRISLIFPLLMIFIKKSPTWAVILVGCFITILELVLRHTIGIGNLGLMYVFMFMIGALLLRHLSLLVSFISSLGAWLKLTFFAAALLFYNYSVWFFPEISWLHRGVIQDSSTTIGVSMLILLSLSSTLAGKILLLKPIHFLGKISYSFYLYHLMINLLIINLFYGIWPMWLLLSVSFVLSVFVSVAAYYVIEKFSIEAGRRLKSIKPKEVIVPSRTT